MTNEICWTSLKGLTPKTENLAWKSMTDYFSKFLDVTRASRHQIEIKGFSCGTNNLFTIACCHGAQMLASFACSWPPYFWIWGSLSGVYQQLGANMSWLKVRLDKNTCLYMISRDLISPGWRLASTYMSAKIGLNFLGISKTVSCMKARFGFTWIFAELMVLGEGRGGGKELMMDCSRCLVCMRLTRTHVEVCGAVIYNVALWYIIWWRGTVWYIIGIILTVLNCCKYSVNHSSLVLRKFLMSLQELWYLLIFWFYCLFSDLLRSPGPPLSVKECFKADWGRYNFYSRLRTYYSVRLLRRRFIAVFGTFYRH